MFKNFGNAQNVLPPAKIYFILPLYIYPKIQHNFILLCFGLKSLRTN